VQPASPAPPEEPGVPAPVEKQALMPVSEATAVQPAGPAPPAEPAVPAPAEKQDLPPVSEGAAVQPGGPSPSGNLDVARPAGRRLTPYLWLPGGVEDAAAFYVSVFKNSRIVDISRYPEGLHAKTWSVMTATVCLDGQDLMLLNGGSVYRPPETFQLLVRCVDQAEVDYYWERLLAGGGEENAGGWLKDRFGVSWQVVPDALMELLTDPNPQRAERATAAMLKMKKIDIAALREAADREP
jgi:predicted 3-demethylubiquinone-9 3-methyltransferase (glyoxalase superfamily)